MLTNDHNLISKSCANQLQAMTSLDLLLALPAVIPVIDKFIVRDLRVLCPQRDTILRFTMELLASSIKAHLVAVDAESKPPSTTDKLIYEIIGNAIDSKLASETLLNKTKGLMKEYCEKGRSVRIEDVRRFVKYACAILEEIKVQSGMAAKTLNVCKGIYASLNDFPKKSSALHFDYCRENRKINMTDLPVSQQEKIIAHLATKKHRQTSIIKQKHVERDTTRKKHSRDIKLERAKVTSLHEAPDDKGGMSVKKPSSVTTPSHDHFHLLSSKVSAEPDSKGSVLLASNLADSASADEINQPCSTISSRQVFGKSSKKHQDNPCKLEPSQYERLESPAATNDVVQLSKR